MVRTGGKQLVVNHPNGPDFLCSEQSEDASKGWSLLAYRLYVTVHAKTNDKSANFFFVKVRFRIYSISSTYVHSDSGVDRTYHARDTAARVHTGIRIEILENAMFGLIQLSIYVFACSIEETPFRG